MQPSYGSTAASLERFLGLVESYLAQAIAEGQGSAKPLSAFEETLGKLVDLVKPFATCEREPDPLRETWKALATTQTTLSEDIEVFSEELASRVAAWDKTGNGSPRENTHLHATRGALHELTDHCRELISQIDLAVKQAAQAVDIAVRELDARRSDQWDNADINRKRKALEDPRAAGVEALRSVRYFTSQADWLQERFPDAEFRDVDGLVKLVTRSEIEEHDWSLTPGRYVGVAPDEEDEDFDFEKAMRWIHVELKGLDSEAGKLARRIGHNFEALGI